MGTALKGGAGVLGAGALGALARAAEAGRPNVLFIAVDDLRPELDCYGAEHMLTPGIDRLAARGTIFTRAYCQQAVCNPSRASLMTGLRPETVHVYDLQTHFRKNVPDVVTLPQQFKRHGYRTLSFGKIYHGGKRFNDPPSWSEPFWQPRFTGPNAYRNVPPVNALRVEDNELPDGQTADMAIAAMRKNRDRPFFIAAGFVRPHLPFCAPRKYFDLYPPDRIRLPDNMYPPKGAPDVALTNWGELRNYRGIPAQGPITDEQALKLIRGYYAATSYMDAQVGRLLDELEDLGLADKTVISLYGDHGWQLGEHDLWCKHTNFELATQAPLIFSAPGQRAAGKATKCFAEFVDIYPTLCELCGVPAPDGLEGTSLVPAMRDPERSVKTAAFSLYPRFAQRRKDQVRWMGYSMRTDRHRYTEWVEVGKGDPRGWVEQRRVGWIGRGDRASAVELYDHVTDPDENVNVAGRPENRSVVARSAQMLRAGWRAALK
jgi:arylsulfatase A-like enzyme